MLVHMIQLGSNSFKYVTEGHKEYEKIMKQVEEHNLWKESQDEMSFSSLTWESYLLLL